MSARVRVGLELVDSVLRYAAVEEENGGRRLLRLGRCDFDFDAAERLVEGTSDVGLDAVAGAIDDVFDGIDATHFHVVVHPPASTVFTAPVSGASSPAERNEQLHWEAGQLMDLDEEAFKIVVHPVPSEEREDVGPVDWFCVTALRRDVYGDLVALLSRARERVVPHFAGSVYAASAVVRSMERLRPDRDERAACRLLVGQYRDRTEYTLCQRNQPFASCYWDTAGSGDAVYAVAQLVDQVDVQPAAIEDVLLYGPAPNEEVLSEVATLTSRSAERFNPFEALQVDTGQVADEFSYWEYVASVGVTL